MNENKIKKIRKSLGFSQEALARQLGVSARTIVRWEKGGKISPLGQKALKQLLEKLPIIEK